MNNKLYNLILIFINIIEAEASRVYCIGS